MATTILLARHGQSDWNQEQRWQGVADRPLTDLGRAQAQTLARELSSRPPVAVYSSDLSRSRETAEIVASAIGVAVRLDPRLREVDVGEWSGLTRDEVTSRYPEGVKRRRASGTGWRTGETSEAMTARVLEAIGAIASAHPSARVLVVTHGGPMRAVWLASAEAGEARPRVENCEVREIVVRSGRIGRINSN